MEIDLTIEQTGPHEAIPYELLYEADPSREAVADYIARGSCYIARIEGRTVGVSVLLRTRPFTMELVNLCVAEPYRRQGIATRLIAHAAERARAAECRILEVGTGNAGIGQLGALPALRLFDRVDRKGLFRQVLPGADLRKRNRVPGHGSAQNGTITADSPTRPPAACERRNRHTRPLGPVCGRNGIRWIKEEAASDHRSVDRTSGVLPHKQGRKGPAVAPLPILLYGRYCTESFR